MSEGVDNSLPLGAQDVTPDPKHVKDVTPNPDHVYDVKPGRADWDKPYDQ